MNDRAILRWIIAGIILIGISFVGAWFLLREKEKPVENSNTSEPTATSKQNSNQTQSNQGVSNQTATININDDSFGVTRMEVSKGTKVVWVNHDSEAHTVTSNTGLFDSGPIAKDQQYEKIFDQIGEFPYHCTPHPFMKSTIIVK